MSEYIYQLSLDFFEREKSIDILYIKVYKYLLVKNLSFFFLLVTNFYTYLTDLRLYINNLIICNQLLKKNKNDLDYVNNYINKINFFINKLIEYEITTTLKIIHLFQKLLNYLMQIHLIIRI